MPINYEQNFGHKYNDSLPQLGEVMAEVIQFFAGNPPNIQQEHKAKIYGVGGDFAANIISALEEKIDICPSSNEMHGAFSACAQAELTGIGFCLTTYMVGSLPCTSAAALAMTESLPVVFISGAPAETEVNTLAIHHTIHPNSSWKTDYDNALKAFASLGMRVERLQGQRASGQPNIAGERFYQLVAEAYKTKQPIFIEIPRDQVFAKTQPLQLPPSLDKICSNSCVLAGNQLIAEKITEKLAQAKNPVLFLGDRLKHNSKLKRLIIDFAYQYNIPYATTWFAKGLFDEYAPLCLGAYNGIFTQTVGKDYIEQQMDYVIDIATSIFAQDSNSAFGTGTHNIDNFTNKTVLKGSSLLEQDLIEVFELLLNTPLSEKISVFDYKAPLDLPIEVDNQQALDFNNLADTLNELQFDDDTPYIYLPEVGNSYFASYGLKVKKSSLGRGWLTNPWYGAMGSSLPYARVASQLIKENGDIDRAVVITGDGGFHFQLNELIHFLKDATNVTIIYMRNNVYHLGKSSDANIYHCNDQGFDVHSIINAYQGQSKTCTTVGEFKSYFKECVQENAGIRLIEVPAKPIAERQCHELKLLNLYIKSKNGLPEAIAQWQKLLK
jgi:indolepyruvate decarboxylase